MKKNILIYITLLGLFGMLSCAKDETQAVLKSSIVVPTLAVPSADMLLKRADATKILTFAGINADYGFKAFISYTLQMDKTGNNFATPTTIATSFADTFKIQTLDFNGILLGLFDADVKTAVQFRVASSVGTTVPVVYSTIVAANVTPYGLPRLDLSTTPAQKIQSAAGNGVYTGFVKYTAGASFTITDPDALKTYGATAAGVVSVGGANVLAPSAGWYKLMVNIPGLKLTNTKYLVGIVGSSTPNGWSAPDIAMDYDAKLHCWYTTSAVLVPGFIKFRHNEDWGNDFNLGLKDAAAPDLNDLWNNGSSKDIPIAVAGTYTIKLYMEGTPIKCTITKN